MLGAASIAGSFLGARADRPLSASAVLVMAAFALCFGCAIWVLIPRGLALAVRGDVLLAHSGGDTSPGIDEVHRAAVRWMRPHLELNRRKVDRLADWLTLSCGLLAAEIALWTISLTSSAHP